MVFRAVNFTISCLKQLSPKALSLARALSLALSVSWFDDMAALWCGLKAQSWCYNCKNSTSYKNQIFLGGGVATLSTRELIGKLKVGQSMWNLPFLTNVISLNIFGFWTLGPAKQANGLICVPCCTAKIISNSVLESWWQDPSEMWWEGRFTSLICCGQCDAVMSMWTKISKECFQNPVDMQWRIKAVLKAKRDQTQYKQGATNKVAGERMCRVFYCLWCDWEMSLKRTYRQRRSN